MSEEMAMQYQRGYIDGLKEGKTVFEPKTGHWKAKSFHELYCDNCGFDFDIMRNDFIDKMKYCPNCGFRMIEPSEKRCVNCNHYDNLSLDCELSLNCDDCSMYETWKRSEE